MLRRRRRRDDCIRLLASAQFKRKNGADEDQEREQRQQRERDADQVADPARQAREAALAPAGVSVGPSCRTDASKVPVDRRSAASTVECRGIALADRSRSARMQCGLLANLPHRPADPVDIQRRGRHRMARIQASRSASRIETLAMREDLREPGAGHASTNSASIVSAGPSQSPRKTSHTGASVERSRRTAEGRPSVSSCRITKRATCSRSKRTKGNSAIVRIDDARARGSSSPATHAAPPPDPARPARRP